MATCHPERPHLAKGLCNRCYEVSRAPKRRVSYWKDRDAIIARRKAILAKKEPDVKRDSYLRRKYGITLEEYRAFSEAQNGVCAICERPPDRVWLHVDHDHFTGRIRGLLCVRCNRALGVFDWQVLGLKGLQSYIRTILQDRGADETKPFGLNEYQEKASAYARYPAGFMYPSLGLCGEAGEVAEQVKRILRDDDGVITSERKDKVVKEIGDVCWYASQLAREFGTTLEEVAKENLAKLADRASRGKLGGAGDGR